MLEKNTLPKEYIVNVSYLAQEKRRDGVVSKHFFMPKIPIVSCPFAPNSDCKEFQHKKCGLRVLSVVLAGRHPIKAFAMDGQLVLIFLI